MLQFFKNLGDLKYVVCLRQNGSSLLSNVACTGMLNIDRKTGVFYSVSLHDEVINR
mgnify:CR=1 FL=1